MLEELFGDPASDSESHPRRVTHEDRVNRAKDAGYSYHLVLTGLEEEPGITTRLPNLPKDTVHVVVRGARGVDTLGYVKTVARLQDLTYRRTTRVSGKETRVLCERALYHSFASLAEARAFWDCVFPGVPLTEVVNNV